MKTSFLRYAVAPVLVALGLAACTTPQSGNVVSANQSQTASRVLEGTVTGSRPVTVKGDNAPADVVGTVLGGVAGAALGQQVGGGTGKVVATGLGATAGAAAGNAVAGRATQSQSTEWFVTIDGGQRISVIQAEPTFAVGQRVQVVQNGSTTRLVP